jgi:hypothetical protein
MSWKGYENTLFQHLPEGLRKSTKYNWSPGLVLNLGIPENHVTLTNMKIPPIIILK